MSHRYIRFNTSTGCQSNYYSLQNFGENTLALLLYLSSPPSGATANASTIASLTRGYTKPTTVYFSLLGKFWMYSFRTADALYLGLLGASIGLVVLGTGASSISGQGFAKPALAVTLAFVGCLIGSNAVALLMKFVLRKPLSWFRSEYSTMVLYGPPAVLGEFFHRGWNMCPPYDCPHRYMVN